MIKEINTKKDEKSCICLKIKLENYYILAHVRKFKKQSFVYSYNIFKLVDF